MRRLSLLLLALTLVGCDDASTQQPRQSANSGVRATSIQVQTQPNGLTAEQTNVRQRLIEDNKPGAIKHLYVISAYSGQVILYSTVRGKVTSSGKRLTPITVTSADGQYVGTSFAGIPVNIGGEMHRTTEVLQDDGTYGTSNEYIYWWDVRGVYHQHYISGGQIVHVSSQPLHVSHIIINIETAAARDSN